MQEMDSDAQTIRVPVYFICFGLEDTTEGQFDRLMQTELKKKIYLSIVSASARFMLGLASFRIRPSPFM